MFGNIILTNGNEQLEKQISKILAVYWNTVLGTHHRFEPTELAAAHLRRFQMGRAILH